MLSDKRNTKKEAVCIFCRGQSVSEGYELRVKF